VLGRVWLMVGGVCYGHCTYQGVPKPRVLCWLAILAKLVMRYRPAIIMNIAQQTRVVSGQR
jgi:hypothetical protein